MKATILQAISTVVSAMEGNKRGMDALYQIAAELDELEKSIEEKVIDNKTLADMVRRSSKEAPKS